MKSFSVGLNLCCICSEDHGGRGVITRTTSITLYHRVGLWCVHTTVSGSAKPQNLENSALVPTRLERTKTWRGFRHTSCHSVLCSGYLKTSPDSSVQFSSVLSYLQWYEVFNRVLWIYFLVEKCLICCCYFWRVTGRFQKTAVKNLDSHTLICATQMIAA